MVMSSNRQGLKCGMDFNNEDNLSQDDSSIVDLNHDIGEDIYNGDDKEGICRKGKWSLREDKTLIKFVQKNGIKKGINKWKVSWGTIASKLDRTPKSCRLRWCNQLAPEISFEPFTAEEDEFIIHMVHTRGRKWSRIAGMLPGRTDNLVKNRWHSALKKVHRQRQPQQDSRVRVGQISNQKVKPTHGNPNGSRPSKAISISAPLPISSYTSAGSVAQVPPASLHVCPPYPPADSLNYYLSPAFHAPHPSANQIYQPASFDDALAPAMDPTVNWLTSLSLCPPSYETLDVMFPDPYAYYPSLPSHSAPLGPYTALVQEAINCEPERPNCASDHPGFDHLNL